jgi:hypothetical protein
MVKKLLSVLALEVLLGYVLINSGEVKERYKVVTLPQVTFQITTVVLFEPVYCGGNMTAPKEVTFEETEDYDLFAGFSESDINLMAAIVYYEAGNQCMEGKQYVVDCILNRLDSKKFPDSIVEILSSPKQFPGTYKKAAALSPEKIPIECYGAVIHEIHERSNYEVIYFSSEGYNGPTPLFKCGDHYFSK